MKKKYETPLLETEIFELNENIAQNCKNVVSNGPEEGTHKLCEDYTSPFSLRKEAVYDVNFYEDTNCDCYTTGDDGQYWTS